MKNTLVQMKVIAIGVWKESLRNKGFFTLICTFFFFLFLSHVVSAAALANSHRILQSSGFFFLGIFGVLTNIFIGTSLIKEINEKRIYMILVRPIGRATFLAGKFLGNISVLVSIFIIVSLGWVLILIFNHVSISWIHCLTLAFLLGEWIIIAGASLFFASFTTPLLHGLFLFAVAFAGHFSKDLVVYATTSTNFILKKVAIYIYYILPNLELINFRSLALYGRAVHANEIAIGICLIICWTGILFTGAGIIFSNKRLS